jgi:ABC-type multidrug transport system fused ATPase/permease subunit
VLIGCGLALLFTIYVVKTVFLVFLAWGQSRFLASVQRGLGQRLFETYLVQPWTFHLQHNSAELIRNVTAEVSAFTSAFTSLIGAATDLLMLGAIACLLLAVQPLGALAVAVVLGFSTYVFQKLTRARINRWGLARQQHDALKYKHLYQGMGGIKDLKIRGAEAEFASRYRTHDDAVTQAAQRQNVVMQLPRLWYELVAVVGLCMLATAMLLQGTPSNVFIPTLGLFAASAFRVLPSANRLIMALQSLGYAGPAIDTLDRELRLPQPRLGAAVERMGFRSDLTLDHVSFTYPQAPQPALHDVSLRVPRGSSIGLIGESGAGKSTLVDVILGLLTPSSGAVMVDDCDVALDPRPWQNIIGYVPQAIYLCDDSLRQNVAFGVTLDRINDDAVRRAISAAQLDSFVAGLPQGLDTLVGERGVRLSGGQRQRIGIARALYHDPEVLVLDEATSALDTETERSVMDAVEALHGSKTLIIVAHRLSTVANCDILYRLQGGRVMKSGSFAEITAS